MSSEDDSMPPPYRPGFGGFGKVFNYAGWKNLCNNIFIVFSAVFIISRLVIFPFWLIHCTWVYPVQVYKPFFGYYFFNIMLIILQCLHVFWAYLILCMAYKFITGQILEDERSDPDETDISEEEGESTHNGSISHKHLTVNNNNHHKAD